MVLYHVTSRDDVAAIRRGVQPPENRRTQFGEGFYTFRDRDDAERWAQIREAIIGDPSSILLFDIPDPAWQGLRIIRVSREHDFRFRDDTIAALYGDADVLEGPWAPTISLPEQAMAGAWQYKFNARVYYVLDAALRSEGDE